MSSTSNQAGGNIASSAALPTDDSVIYRDDQALVPASAEGTNPSSMSSSMVIVEAEGVAGRQHDNIETRYEEEMNGNVTFAELYRYFKD